MDTRPTPDLAAPVRYALTHRPSSGDTVDLVLDLFRGVVQIHTRTIVSVEREQAVLVMAKCRRYLQLRGVDAAPATLAAATAPAVRPSPAIAAPQGTVAASLARPVRPAPGAKPKAKAAAPAKAGVAAAARSTAASVPRDRSPAARPPARAAAAFDWMFEAV